MEQLVKNWLQYKVLSTGPFRSEDLKVNITEKQPLSNEITKKAVDQLWSDMVKGRKSVGKEAWNSSIYSLTQFKKQNDHLIIDIGTTTFKHLQGTNATYWLLGDMFGKEYLANGLLVQAMVFDNEGNCIFGKRNTGVRKEYEPFVIFGGTMDKDDKSGKEIKKGHDPFVAIDLELEEELGLDKEVIKDIYIMYLIEDKKYYPVFYFNTLLNISFKQLYERFVKFGDKTEHSDIVVLDKNEMQNVLENTPERASDLTLTAIDLYLKNTK